MADLTDVLGAVLRDIARARVVSDLFSRDISKEYAADPILEAFPVPRADIRQASVGLAFAVAAVNPRTARLDDVIEAHARTHGAAFVQGLLEDLVERAGLDRDALRTELVQAVDDAVRGDPKTLEKALDGSPELLAQRLTKAATEVLLTDAERLRALTRERSLADVREVIAAAAAGCAAGFGAAAALVSARRAAGAVDVSVSLRELLDVPEAVLSRIELITEIRNYTWVDVGDGERSDRRLQPE
ncbi:hypothetical protein [Streptomyces sp. MN13]